MFEYNMEIFDIPLYVLSISITLFALELADQYGAINIQKERIFNPVMVSIKKLSVRKAHFCIYRSEANLAQGVFGPGRSEGII